MTFMEALREQRWDDHRYYHHCRINQSLHFLSALCFLTAYVMLPENPVVAAFLGWICAMPARQLGHFFFEPKEYDEINRASHEHKEDIKVGYNLSRKIVLLSIWALSPLFLLWQPTLFGTIEPYANGYGFVEDVAVMWLVVAAGAILGRTLQLFYLYDVQTGLVWAAKIFTDPFHDVLIYHKAPIRLLHGERYDPMTEWHVNVRQSD